MRLSIDQAFAKIGIETTRPEVEMRRTDPGLELHQKHAQIKIHSENPKVQIDQSAAFASAGLKGYRELTRENTQIARSQVMEYIAKTAQDGRRLAAIELGGNPIAEIAKRDAYPEKQFGYGSIPTVGPEITVIEGSVTIDPGETGSGVHNGVEAEVTPGDIDYNFIRGNVNIYILQKNYLHISFEPENINIYV